MLHGDTKEIFKKSEQISLPMGRRIKHKSDK